MTGHLEALTGILAGVDPLAVAVSGGVDSMTLAHVACAARPGTTTLFHAVSPAVTAEATRRVQDHAQRHGWTLRLLDAGELADRDYVRNPVNRCYFCKSNLYRSIRAHSDATIASGTNLDDLSDFRPGLAAAAERGVRHPFVEAGIDKEGVRGIARALGLADLAELPAQPCLASRIETGIAISPADLALVEAVEGVARAAFGPGDVRCRIVSRGAAVRLELPAAAVTASNDARARLRADVEALCADAGKRFLGWAPYRRGSAFLGSSPGIGAGSER